MYKKKECSHKDMSRHDHYTMRLARHAHLQAEEQKLKEEICRAVEAEERDHIRQEEEAERMREKY